MRILCLHGKGTSADIFESQTDSVRQLLPDHYEYVFPEADTPSGAAPGIGQLFPGPYFCWCRDDSIGCVAEQHKIILDIIEEEGPFDAVMAFSQGAALIASVLLHHEVEQPLQPPPFRCAIFICATQPFTKTATEGVDITEEVQLAKQKEAWTESVSPGHTEVEASLGDSRCRWFDPDVVRTRIRIPTAHINGARDKFAKESNDLARLCDRKFVYEHPGGHEIPVQPDRVLRVVDVVKKTLDETNYFM